MVAILLSLISIFVSLSHATFPGMVAGKVLNSQTGLPIPNVQVWTNAGQSAITDASGNYMMQHPSGYFDMYFGKYYYESKTVGIHVVDNEIATYNVNLKYTGTQLAVNNPCFDGCRTSNYMRIYWTPSQNYNYVSIKLFKQSGCLWLVEKTIASSTQNDGYYQWYISGVELGEKRVQISAQDVYGNTEIFDIY